MLKELQELENISRTLEPSFEQRKHLNKDIIAYADNFLARMPDAKMYVDDTEEENPFTNFPISETALKLDTLLKLLEQHVDNSGINAASKGHLGYVPGGGIYAGALGDYLANVSNRYTGMFFASPAGVRMENQLISWFASELGYPKTAAGNITSGGSVASLTAVITARESVNLKAKDFDKAVVYLSEQTHHASLKALHLAGLKECVKRYISCDKNCKIDPQNLESQILRDKKEGLIPFMLIATAGSTNTGMIDPLEAIGIIAKKHKIWYHIDGAYGGLFALCQEGKQKLKGIELSDSVVIDPHKGLFLPFGTGIVLVKEAKKILAAHHFTGAYFQDIDLEKGDYSPADVSVELSRPFRGLKLWLALQLHGAKTFRACLEEKLLLAKYFYQEIAKNEDFEVGTYPDLSIVTYRYVPKNSGLNLTEINELNKKLLKAVQDDGKVYISSTNLNGKFILRAAILSFRTHKDTVDVLLAVLKEKAAAIKRCL